MFKIVANPTFTCPVFLSRPDADVPIEVEITFKHKGTKDLQAWLASAGEHPDDATFLDQVMAGWGRFVDAESKPVPYSKEALTVVLDTFPSAGTELVQAYRNRLSDARAKN